MTALTEFSAEPLTSPISYGEVEEGKFASEQLQLNLSHLVTVGIKTCKAVAIYNPDEQYGVLAHLNGTTKPDKMVSNMLDGFPFSPRTAEVSLVQATTDRDTFLWPDIDMLAQLFKQHGPRSIRLDRNDRHKTIRGIALNLETGDVADVSKGNDLLLTQSNHVPVKNNHIRKHLIGSTLFRLINNN